MSPPLRRIAHLDMDAFYASVELLRYPQLKGLPVVIGGRWRREDDVLARAAEDGSLDRIPLQDFPRIRDYVGRGVITTATYAARQFGVGSAMGIMKAAKLCPDAIMLPVDFDEYRRYSRRFKEVILAHAPVMENRGVDEVYIDFTEVPGGQEEGGRLLAATIQSAIFSATGLTCSVGVAPNKLLAKMASEFNKPNGISIVHEVDLETLVWPLPCRKINGIGPRTDEKLKSFGIETIRDLAEKDQAWLLANFGNSYGQWLYRAARGLDDRAVQTSSEPVSMSRETTFGRDLHAVADKAELGAIFTRLCEQVAADLERKGYLGRTVGIKVRYDNFKAATRDHTADFHTADAKTIRQLAGQCLKRVPLERRIRLLGVRVGGLVRREEVDESGYLPGEAAPRNLSLFED
ncbi:MAG TPA: DNA polymerase IV [Moraxellaceae bacterium]